MPIQVKEVVSAAAQLVGRDDLYKKAQEGGEDEELSLLFDCFSRVENEVALDYFPLKAVKSVFPDGGKIAFSSFEKYPVDILSVVSPSGMDIPFEVYSDHIEVAKNTPSAVVSYTYAPTKKGAEESSELPEKISLVALSSGVAAEFLLAHGLYAEAAAFETRYHEALLGVEKHAGKKYRMSARRWV